jgi:hypothetical protein
MLTAACQKLAGKILSRHSAVLAESYFRSSHTADFLGRSTRIAIVRRAMGRSTVGEKPGAAAKLRLTHYERAHLGEGKLGEDCVFGPSLQT